MPCFYRILPHENVLAKFYSGKVTTRCVLDLIDAFESDPQLRPNMRQFDDLSEVEALEIPEKDMAQFVDLLTGLSIRKQMPTHKVVYAPHGPGRTIALEFSQLVKDNSRLDVVVFDDFEKAASFLGIDDPARLRQPSPATSESLFSQQP